jgi:hypothetical protein
MIIILFTKVRSSKPLIKNTKFRGRNTKKYFLYHQTSQKPNMMKAKSLVTQNTENFNCEKTKQKLVFVHIDSVGDFKGNDLQ